MLPQALPSVVPRLFDDSLGVDVTFVGIEEQAVISKLKAVTPLRRTLLCFIKYPFKFI